MLDGRYEVVELIASGGMSDVHRGRDTVLDRTVALKVFRPTGPGDLGRFRREIALLARLEHRNLVRLFDAGDHDGAPFLVMELVEGPTRARRLVAGPLPVAEVAPIYVVHHDRDEALELHTVDRDPLDPVEEVTAALGRSAAKRLAMDERVGPAPDPTVDKLPPVAEVVDEALRDRLDAARRERAEVEAELESADDRARVRALRRLEVVGRHEAWLAEQMMPSEDAGIPLADIPHAPADAEISL